MNTIIHDHGSGAVSAAVAMAAALVGSLGQLNMYLQTIAYVVSIVAGVCAIVRAIRGRQ